MAYYQFDLTFVNLAALPAGTSGMLVRVLTTPAHEASSFGPIPVAGDLTVSPSTAEPGGSILGPYPTFELIASDQVWFTVALANSTNEVTALYSIGPYTVGDIGTEVPAP